MIDCFRYYAGWADKIHGQTIPVRGNYFCYTRREPVGVCGQIIPWNFPMLMVAWKWGPALAAGCTVVLKPAEQTPLTCLRMGELAMEAGFPPGVINIVPGFGATAGAALVRHPGVDKIAFTGEHHTAQIIMAEAADTLKRLTFELGGKSPNIVFADADLDAAVGRGRIRPLLQPGPVLLRRQPAVRRGEGPRRVRREARRACQDPAARRPVRSATTQGPAGRPGPVRQDPGLHRPGKQGGEVRHRRRALRREGLLHRADGLRRRQGRHAIASDEIFGPVMSVLQFQDVDEVIERANTTFYGLAAAVWTRDIDKAHIRDRAPGRHRLGQLLRRLRRGRPVRRLQDERHRPRTGRRGAGQLHRIQDGHHEFAVKNEAERE